jgi:hypothetical protein
MGKKNILKKMNYKKMTPSKKLLKSVSEQETLTNKLEKVLEDGEVKGLQQRE